MAVIFKLTRSPMRQLNVSGQRIIISKAMKGGIQFVRCQAVSLLAKKGQC